MRTRARVCAWVAGVGLIVPLPALAQDRTERELVELIVRDGPQARAIRAAAEVTRREQRARLAYPNPGVSYSREGAGFTEFLQFEQALPIPGVRAALARAGVAATAAAEADRDARLWALRTEAAAAVARLVAGGTRLEVAETHAREVERLIEILRTREREGEGSRFDRLRAEQELRDARRSVTAAAILTADARAAVTAMMPPAVPLGPIVGAPALPPPPPLDALIARATAARAELRALDRAGERADQEATAARRARLPVPTVSGGLKRAGEEGARLRGGVFGLQVSVPLFDTGGREAARWTAERVRAGAERAALEAEIRAEIARAREALTLRQAAAAADEASAGEDLARIAEVGYREGELGILELLDAVRTSTRARARSIEIDLDARLASIALERAVGDVLWP